MFTNHSGLLAARTCGCFFSPAERWRLQVKSSLAEQSDSYAIFWIYSSINLRMAFWTVYYYRTVGNPFWERSGTVDIYHYKVYCNTLSPSFEIKAFELQMIKYIHTPSETRIFLAFCQYRLGCEIYDILHYFFAVIKALSQLKSPLPSSKCHWAAASLDAWEWIYRSRDCREQSQALCYTLLIDATMVQSLTTSRIWQISNKQYFGISINKGNYINLCMWPVKQGCCAVCVECGWAGAERHLTSAFPKSPAL